MINAERRLEPNIRFPEFSGNWILKKLSELGYFIRGLTYSPNNVTGNGLLVLRSSNIQSGELAFDDNVYVSLEVDNESKAQEGDILICVRNGSKRLIGKNTLITAECPESTHGAFMSIFRGGHNKFVYQLFQTQPYQKQIYVDLGATINSINGRNLKKYKFYFPENDEKEKIANFLSAVDKKTSLLKQKHTLLQQYKKGVMQQLLPQQIRFKDDSGNDFPDWKEHRLREILVPQGNSLNMCDEKEYELVTVKRRNVGIVSRGNYKGKDVLVKNQFTLKGGQFVISKRQIIHGAFGIVPDSLSKAIVSNEYNVFEADKDKLDIHYFNLLATTLDMKKAFFKNSEGAHIEKLWFKTKSWLKTKALFPCVDEQLKILAFINSLDKKINLTAQQIQLTQTFKKGLLQQVFVQPEIVKENT